MKGREGKQKKPDQAHTCLSLAEPLRLAHGNLQRSRQLSLARILREDQLTEACMRRREPPASTQRVERKRKAELRETSRWEPRRARRELKERGSAGWG